LNVGVKQLDDERGLNICLNGCRFGHDDMDSLEEDGRKMHTSRATR
jgi:hypothetical protein